MKTQKYVYGIEFSSDETNINDIRLSDLLAIAFNKAHPKGANMPSNKEISLLLMQGGVKHVEIIRDRQNKYIFDARFYY
jgi:hypothetical protein